ncbi:putative Cro-like repressor [Lactobacillus phage Ld25A]|uniref:Putative Cro-like repressor n=1 Tax=Lactobacillus phage Ld25A TaxID=1500734 RepID=A0A075KJS4_9CAUD|nr:putative Cro-like repressor [Lactobacillus phage Ld25A]AIF54346.1 putative Cro-like repressor [Lactobacillus phage Ld25A]
MCKRKNLKVFRVKQDLTQEELAKKLGVSVAHYGAVERGTYDPSYKMMSNFFRLYPQEKFEIFDKEEM